MAHAMVASYGMSPAIGPVAVGEKQGEVFMGRDLAQMSNVSAVTLELVDEETRRIVREAEETAKQVIGLNRGVLDQLANALMEDETLSGPALEAHLGDVARWPEPLLTGATNGDAPVRLRRPARISSEA